MEWTVYLEDEVIDVMSDREVAELLMMAHGPEIRLDITLDFFRAVVVLE